MFKHGRERVPMKVMGLLSGEFVDEYAVMIVDVFSMLQSGTGVKCLKLLTMFFRLRSLICSRKLEEATRAALYVLISMKMISYSLKKGQKNSIEALRVPYIILRQHAAKQKEVVCLLSAVLP